MTSEGAQIMLVMQLYSEVVVFNLNNSDFYDSTRARNLKMLNLPMERAPNQQVYFAVIDYAGDQSLMCLHFKEKSKLKLSVAYRAESQKIIAYQVVDIEARFSD